MAIAKEGPSDEHQPIVISGGGCVGLFLALLLAHSSIPNRIIVIEPQTPDPTSTRAMAHQPPTFPLFSQIPGLLPELIAAGTLSSGLCFRTSVKNGSTVIASKTFQNEGEGMKGKGQLLLPQGKFQNKLMSRLSKLSERAEVRLGWSVTSFTQSPSSSSVSVELTSSSGSTSSIDAAYLVGADGGQSLVRRHLNVSLEGETLDRQLVATDLRFPFKAHGFFDANFIVDQEDYGLIGRIDNDGLWRVSYGVPGELSEEEIHVGLKDKLRSMLPNEGRDEKGEDAFEVVKVAPYRAQQRCASTLAQGRVLLVGDAAHCKSPFPFFFSISRRQRDPPTDLLTVTNPYAGLGLASGIADADSLSPILAHILFGKASNASQLLSSWSEARRQKFFDVVDKPSRMAYKRVRSKVDTEEDIKALLERDPVVGALKKGMPVMPPSLRTVGEELEGW
jgi:2-polyprenyl-6-methoxyphenol hydroxylase-like FAD-dependent oxidoreductase